MNSGDSTVSILYPPLNFNYLVKLNFVMKYRIFIMWQEKSLEAKCHQFFCVTERSRNNSTPEKALVWSCVRQKSSSFPHLHSFVSPIYFLKYCTEFIRVCLYVYVL